MNTNLVSRVVKVCVGIGYVALGVAITVVGGALAVDGARDTQTAKESDKEFADSVRSAVNG